MAVQIPGAKVTAIKERNGMFGTPLCMPMWFDGQEVPLEPIVTITRKKRIIETELDDIEETFKEGFTNGSYDITIQGTILDESILEPEDYPEKVVRVFRRLFNRTVKTDDAGNILEGIGNIKVTHQLLNVWGIYHIVIVGYTIPQIPGQNTRQDYTLECKSDINWKLKLEQP